MRRKILLSASLALHMGVTPAWAHHSFAAQFDAARPVTVRGVITEIKWENPHIWVYLDAKDQNGKVARWGFEACGPACVIRNGVKPALFKPGITVTINGFHARDASRNFGSAREVVLVDGRSFAIGPKGN